MQLFVSCKSEPPSPIVIKEDPLVIQELSPLPRAIVSARAEEYESVYSIFRIIEVSEVNGVQQFFLARLGSDRTGIDVGVSESIAEDEKFEKIIGKFTIIEIFGDFFRCEIEELDYKIGAAAYIRIKTGEKLKEI
jgi:hypothetical protein